MTNEPEKWSSLEEIAEHLGVSKDTIRNWIKKDVIPYRRIGKLYKFKISEKESINITVSIGIASYPEVTSDMNKMTEDADSALYNAKRNGRNMVILFDGVNFKQ